MFLVFSGDTPDDSEDPSNRIGLSDSDMDSDLLVATSWNSDAIADAALTGIATRFSISSPLFDDLTPEDDDKSKGDSPLAPDMDAIARRKGRKIWEPLGLVGYQPYTADNLREAGYVVD